MTIMFTEKTQATWYVSLPGGNWIASVDKTEKGFEGTYRFRWYKDEKAWDSDDVKTWLKVDGEDLAAGINSFRFIANKLKKLGGGEFYEVLRGTGTNEQFFEEFKKLPFVHIREEKLQ